MSVTKQPIVQFTTNPSDEKLKRPGVTPAVTPLDVEFAANPPDEKSKRPGVTPAVAPPDVEYAANQSNVKFVEKKSVFRMSHKMRPYKSPNRPVSQMHRWDFQQVECNGALTLTGMSWIGNASLWRMGRKNRIGVYADASSSNIACGNLDQERSQWAIEMGAQHKCLVGTFFTWPEKEILRLHLRHGGRAIWLLGRSFPKSFNTDCAKAIYENRLLVVSCFWKPRWGYSTYRYCSQLVSMCASSLVFWSLKEGCCAAAIYRKAVAYGVPAELHT